MAKLCKAGIQLREQIDDEFPSRDRRSDGWIADARHLANSSNSDHIPRGGIVRAIDVDANLNDHPEATYALVEQIRKCAKRGDKRIKYIIFDSKISSSILNWKWRKYKGANPHRSHFHISFTTLGDNDSKWFDLTGERHNAKRSKKGSRKLGKSISSSSSSDLPIGGARPGDDSQCCRCRCSSERNQLA
jgi:hypothetical protein